MSQSNIIAGYILVGFLIYITMRGELSQYASVLGLSKSA